MTEIIFRSNNLCYCLDKIEVENLSEEALGKALETLGLTKKESEIYILLAKHGMMKGGEIAKQAGMHKAQAYSLLKNMQGKELIESTLESPARFGAVSLEHLLDSFIQAKRNEAVLMEREKNSLLASWRTFEAWDSKSPPDRFVVILGRNKVRDKMIEMISEARKSIQTIMTSIDIIRADREEITDALMNKSTSQSISVSILTQVSKENLSVLKRIWETDAAKRQSMRWRDLEAHSEAIPRVLIKDGDEALILPPENRTKNVVDETCLWTTSRLIVNVTSRLFEELWQSARLPIEATTKLGTVSGRTFTIRDWKLAQRQFNARVDRARKEIIEIGPSITALGLLGKRSIQEICAAGVKVRIMFPINAANLNEAQKISKYCEIRDPNIGYLGMAVIDREELYQFNVQPNFSRHTDASTYFKNVFYTDDPKVVANTLQMLNGLWTRSTAIPNAKK